MARKGRPKKVRYIQKMPSIVQFSPRGRPGRPDEAELTLDQYEAIKLADHQGFSQERGAAAMRVSRASFGRILRGARRKIAGALVCGKVIKIRLGDVQVGVRKEDLTKETFDEQLSGWHKRNKRMARQVKMLSNKGKP